MIYLILIILLEPINKKNINSKNIRDLAILLAKKPLKPRDMANHEYKCLNIKSMNNIFIFCMNNPEFLPNDLNFSNLFKKARLHPGQPK